MLFEADIFTIFLFGITANFLFSMLFAFFINTNIPFMELIELAKRERNSKKPIFSIIILFMPFVKATVILYRVYILQIYFLNRGKSYRDFAEYLFTK
jgi:hypothetical protein